MSKKLSLLQLMLESWQILSVLPFKKGVKIILVLSVLILGFSKTELTYTSLFFAKPAYAQRVNPSEVWQQVYKQLPDLPKENNYTSQETGKVATNNTLVSRMIRYHIYVKGRPPNYRLDWKLTLADYLDANEVMYETLYPGHDTLRQNPFAGDRAAIRRLNRQQRNALVQALVNVFSQN
ncbi:hypothetical protein [Chlorogloeopsis sp. ULAP02]|uniref:hypothetical protein n=1 Tax=Chlorogloeopsis sp. ULAP02 TaxID=3107926 RepID=UPI0031347AA1